MKSVGVIVCELFAKRVIFQDVDEDVDVDVDESNKFSNNNKFNHTRNDFCKQAMRGVYYTNPLKALSHPYFKSLNVQVYMCMC